jgi:hypothetical protein
MATLSKPKKATFYLQLVVTIKNNQERSLEELPSTRKEGL